MYNYDIRDWFYSKTLKDAMIENYMSVPHEWQDEDKMSIFDKAYFGIIPSIEEHKADEQDE